MRILLIEDAPDIARLIVTCLEAECFVIDVATDGEKGSFLARTNYYDLVILDNMLPQKNGRQVCDEIRMAGKTMPILMLSVIAETKKKVEMLNAGADDYLTKPFSVQELVARVKALLRRPREARKEQYALGDIVLDGARHVVVKAGKEVYLTRKEFSLLEYLLQNVDIALSRSMIMEHVWDINADPFSNTIESHIMSVRKKIDPDGRYIMTVPGIGYKIVSP